MSDEEQRRRALVNAVTDYPTYYLRSLHPKEDRRTFVWEITQELRAAAADASITGIVVSIGYEYAAPAVTQLNLLTAEETR